MKKITSLVASALLLMGMSANAQITSPVMSTGKLMTAEELNASEGTKRIAIQLSHQVDYRFWYNAKIGGSTNPRQADFTNAVVFEWVKGTDGHYLKNVSLTEGENYMQNTSTANFGNLEKAQVISVVTPLAEGGVGNTATNWDQYCPAKEDANNKFLCRFVDNATKKSWINSNNTTWHDGTGVWTMFYTYDLTNHVDGQVKFNAFEGTAVKGLAADDKLATFSSSVATKIPAGVRAFYVETATEGEPAAQLKEIKDNIPANQGVILVSKNETEVMTAAEGEVAPLTTSALKGSASKYAKNLQNVYVLATQDGTTQFYKTSGNLAPNKAYLELSAAAATVALNFPGEATAIEGIEAEEEANAPIYDLSGRKVNSTVKGGVFIQNGKKFIAK